MTSAEKEVCPVCRGKKVVDGNCECSMEWRGTGSPDGDEWQDCQCTPELECTNCRGTGYVQAKK